MMAITVSRLMDAPGMLASVWRKKVFQIQKGNWISSAHMETIKPVLP